MRITKSSHKALLNTLFYTRREDGSFVPKQFTFDKLFDAASAAKKLMEGSTVKGDEVTYITKEIELTPAEVVILKHEFDENKDKFDITIADTVFELNELFEGKEGGKI